MTRSPEWLDEKRIERREEVLRVVEELIRVSESREGTPAARFQSAVLFIARKAVKEARSRLSKAAMEAAKTGRPVPVDADTLEFVREFSGIGIVKLRSLRAEKLQLWASHKSDTLDSALDEPA